MWQLFNTCYLPLLLILIIIIDLAQVQLIYLEKASYLCVWKVAMSDPPTPDCHSPKCGEHSRVLSLIINSIFDTTNKTRKNNNKRPAKVLLKQNEKLGTKILYWESTLGK